MNTKFIPQQKLLPPLNEWVMIDYTDRYIGFIVKAVKIFEIAKDNNKLLVQLDTRDIKVPLTVGTHWSWRMPTPEEYEQYKLD